MKANELRVNNLVMDRGGKVLRIDWFERDKVCMQMMLEGQDVYPMTEEFEYLKPIPLTEEWLLNFGFKRDKDIPTWILKGGFRFGSNMTASYSTNSIYKKCMMYVHQLQNCYYDFTGEELITSTDGI